MHNCEMSGNVACNPRSTHAPGCNPDVLFPLLWAYMMDREEVGLFTQIYTAYGAARICWQCLLLTQHFNQEDNTPEWMEHLQRTRQQMYEIIRDHPEQAQALSLHRFPPLAMDICRIVPVDYHWVLADRFHHITVVMWRVKSYTEELMAKMGTLGLLVKRFKETPRHRLVKPWPRGIVPVDKVSTGVVMVQQAYGAVSHQI